MIAGPPAMCGVAGPFQDHLHTKFVTMAARCRLSYMRLHRRSAPPAIDKADAEWRDQLSADQYRVLRKKGTERPFTGTYVHTDDTGTYRCAACGAALFDSGAKFDSGTGWPSFTEPAIAEAVRLQRDLGLGMLRTEVTCRRCGGHLGHVFNDGPGAAGRRYCINSCALDLDSRRGRPG